VRLPASLPQRAASCQRDVSRHQLTYAVQVSPIAYVLARWAHLKLLLRARRLSTKDLIERLKAGVV
jgi:hypothetical protein